MQVLVLNAGSSSQKSCLYQLTEAALPEQPPKPLWQAHIDWTAAPEVGVLTVKAQGKKLEKKLDANARHRASGQMLNTLVEGDTQVLGQLSEIDIVGLSQGVDMISLSFVRRAEDIQALKELLAQKGAANTPVLEKIEKPQAIANLTAILDECDAVMVARGDLGAEASDVANAIIDGTDAVILSGESAIGDFPLKAVEMLARIATDVEKDIQFVNILPATADENHALSEALNAIDQVLDLHCIRRLHRHQVNRSDCSRRTSQSAGCRLHTRPPGLPPLKSESGAYDPSCLIVK